MGKINRSLANAGLPQIEDWDSWKKSFLKRGRKVKKNLKGWGCGGSCVLHLQQALCKRFCVRRKGPQAERGKVAQGYLPAFLKSTCVKPLRLVHQDSSKCNHWRERWGELEGTTPTVRQLFTVSQLRAVIPDIENSSEWKLRFS